MDNKRAGLERNNCIRVREYRAYSNREMVYSTSIYPSNLFCLALPEYFFSSAPVVELTAREFAMELVIGQY